MKFQLRPPGGAETLLINDRVCQTFLIIDQTEVSPQSPRRHHQVSSIKSQYCNEVDGAVTMATLPSPIAYFCGHITDSGSGDLVEAGQVGAAGGAERA